MDTILVHVVSSFSLLRKVFSCQCYIQHCEMILRILMTLAVRESPIEWLNTESLCRNIIFHGQLDDKREYFP